MNSLDGSRVCIALIYLCWSFIAVTFLYKILNFKLSKLKNYFSKNKVNKGSQKYRTETSPEIESDGKNINRLN